jgi:hypothetical protein
MNPLVFAALGMARAQIGVEEIGATNSGPAVDQYLARVGLTPGQPWCAAFWCWCIDKAAHDLGIQNPVKMSGSCRTLANWAASSGILRQAPQPGFGFLRWSTVAGEYRAAHIGHITKITSAGFWTIEGNSNNSGSRDGRAVVQLRRVHSNAYRYIDWAELLERK